MGLLADSNPSMNPESTPQTPAPTPDLTTVEGKNAAIDAALHPVKPKRVLTPEQLAKLAEARKKYAEDLKAGRIKPPERKPKPAEVVDASHAEEAAPVAKKATQGDKELVWTKALRDATEFKMSHVRFELSAQAKADTEQLYVTYFPDRDRYTVESPASEMLDTYGEWFVVRKNKDITRSFYFKSFTQIRDVLAQQNFNLILPEGWAKQ